PPHQSLAKKSQAHNPPLPQWRTVTKPSPTPPPPPPPRRPRPTAASWKRSRPVPVTTHPGKSVAAESPAPNGGVAKEEEKEEGGTGTHVTTKSYAAVAAQAEIEDLRIAKIDLEGKLIEVQRENEANAKEAHRIEGVFAQAREEVTIAEFAAASAEKEVASLRAEVERFQVTLIEKGSGRPTTRACPCCSPGPRLKD
ncbi:unnamed protein product, partial [Urochloa humidicola]